MKIINELISVFFPENCLSCSTPVSKNSESICISCRHDLPFTNYSAQKFNKVEKSFFGRIPIEEATSLLHFHKKGPTQELMHNLKYRNQQKIGKILGLWMANSLKQSGRFKKIDSIVPVPLHKKRLKQRGYNQLTRFGETLALELGIPYISHNLIRIAATKTQTKKFRTERWTNVNTKFHVNDSSAFENKHILLIDDIVTTGATIEACYHAFSEVQDFKMSLATMSYTK